MQARFIEARAGVRYWDDSTLNGARDEAGSMPLREGDLWVPVIDLKLGKVAGWPEGFVARIHYKVCDDGEYWLLDEEGQRIARWKGDYVPDDFLCVDDEGYGDYIIMEIGAQGLVKGWIEPSIDPEAWTAL